MMNQDDAHSGAIPETEDKEPIAAAPDEEFDADDDDPGFEVVYDSALHGPLSATRGGAEAAAPDPEASAPPEPLEPAGSVQPVSPLPTGTLPLLEAQLGEVLKIMQDFATWIRSPHNSIHTCVEVADTVARLAQSSAVLGKVAARVQNGDPESRHRVIVEYAGPQGEGVTQSRKRINHGRT